MKYPKIDLRIMGFEGMDLCKKLFRIEPGLGLSSHSANDQLPTIFCACIDYYCTPQRRLNSANKLRSL